MTASTQVGESMNIETVISKAYSCEVKTNSTLLEIVEKSSGHIMT